MDMGESGTTGSLEFWRGIGSTRARASVGGIGWTMVVGGLRLQSEL
jgi:hypothetical protein